MEKTKVETIEFLKNYIAKNGSTENLEKLLYRMEHEGGLQVDLIPDEIFHDLCGSNVSAIPLEDVPKYQGLFPDYDWPSLRERGINVLKYGRPVLDCEIKIDM